MDNVYLYNQTQNRILEIVLLYLMGSVEYLFLHYSQVHSDREW